MSSPERRENAGRRQEPQDLMNNSSQAPSSHRSEFFQNETISRIISCFFGKEDEIKKEELIRSTQSLHHYMHKYFNITNRLLEILKTHMELNVSPAVLANENESIQQNCDRVRKVMCQIHNVCEEEDKHVRKSTEPVLYEKIAFAVVSLKEKAAVIKELHENTMGVLGNVFGPLVTIQLAKSNLRNLMPSEEDLKSQPVSSLLLEDLVQSSKEITKRLSGSLNQQKSLDEAVQLMQDLLFILRPLCDSYNDILTEVEAYITLIYENM